MVNTAELKQFFPLRENTFRHVVEGDGRYPRAMTPSDISWEADDYTYNIILYFRLPYFHVANIAWFST